MLCLTWDHWSALFHSLRQVREEEEEEEEEIESGTDKEPGDSDGENSSRVTVTTEMVKQWSKKLKEVNRHMLWYDRLPTHNPSCLS